MVQGDQGLFKGHCISSKQAADGVTGNFPDSGYSLKQIQLCLHDLDFGHPKATQNEVHGFILNQL